MLDAALPDRFSSRQVEGALSVPRATLLWMADRLPVTRHGRPGKARVWTTKDVITVYLATQLGDKGILPTAAIDMAAQVERHFEDIFVKSEEGQEYYLAAFLEPNEMGRFESVISSDKEEVISFLERDLDGIAVFNLTKMIKRCFALLLAHVRDKKGGEDA